jgi:hypothetical protein
MTEQERIELSNEFAKKVKWTVDEDTECWNASGVNNGEGYKYLSIRVGKKNKRKAAHRMSYEIFNGVIPEGYSIMHMCDNRKCINPNHLKAGTRKDNTQDMMKKNRYHARTGSRQKLTTKQIKDIKKSELSSYKLAEIYPVSATQIRRIKCGSRCANI